MLEYILRLLILLPMIGGLAWGSLWLWKRVQMGVPLVGGNAKERAIQMVDILPLGPGSKLAVVEFGGRQILIAVSRNGITRLADDDSQGDFHVD
ncbi:FliO/MopB family protein [Sphingopyxis sp. R3-92]|uniref:FliO/MopB family protein n=1 Tax=Sphingopyxis sp. R3-92 TaxID=3158553 RepID=UPI003EE4713A